MDSRTVYVPELGGNAAVTDFAALLPAPGAPCPATRIQDFLTLGPFVLETDECFETEYLYKRHKTLDCDYLASSGGEAAARPVLNAAVQNDYYGPAVLRWRAGYQKWDMLRFDREGEDCDDAFFATPQRNCVYYAAVYVRCHGPQRAVVCYENSGCLLYLNGRLIDEQPYGRVKGLPTLGRRVAVRFEDGLNLLLFKLRTGYICDTMDLSISHMSIHPVMAMSGVLGVTYPEPTGAYMGDADAPRQAMYTFAAAYGDVAGGMLTVRAGNYAQELAIPALTEGGCAALRMGVPAQKHAALVRLECALAADGAAPAGFVCEAETLPAPAHWGEELLLADFHFDTTYHQEQRTYALGALFIASRMAEELRRDPDFRAILSEIDYLHPYYSIYPEDRALLREAFRSGRAEADCFYNQPNELTSSPEALVRNLIYGQRYHKDYLGQPEVVYGPQDVFGHPNQMSQICAKGECIACRWGKTVVGLDNAFRHMSPDGTQLVHTKGITRDDARRLHLNRFELSSQLPDRLPPYPVEDGMPWTGDSATHARYSTFTELEHGVMADDEAHRAATGRGALGLTSRDLTKHHSGVLLTRSDFKQANRLAENLLVSAEKLAAIAALHGADYPEKALDKAWRQVLCAQHHDSVTGTNNEISFVDLMLEYREAVELAQAVLDGAARAIAAHVASPTGGQRCVVFNPHPWERREPCVVALPGEGGWVARDAEGREYPLSTCEPAPDGAPQACFLPDAPALGYRAYALLPVAQANAPRIDGGCTIENEFFRLTIDPDQGGGIVSLLDKATGREVMAPGADGPGNRVAVLREVPDRMETQHELYTTGQKLLSSDSRARVRRVCTGAYERLEVTVQLDVIARLRQTITLWQGVPRVDMTAVVEDYQGRDDLFTVTFPVSVSGGRVIYDDRFAPHVCGKSVNKLSFKTHQYISYSHSRIAPVNQWIELGPTLPVELGDAGVLQLGMTALVRREGRALAAADALLEALTRRAIPVTPFPEGEQHGGWQVIHFNEDITDTDTRIVLSLMDEPLGDYAGALMTRMDAAQRQAFDSALEQSGAAVLYCVDDDNMLQKPIDVLLVRARDAQALARWTDGVRAQLAAAPRLRLDDAVCLTPAPQEDDYGVALINRGSISCSVEGDNLLNMMLFHTADFYGNKGRVTGGDQLIPEQKTFCASYALYPHAGDYRRAQVYRRAMEFNDPLLAACGAPAAGAELPAAHSYLNCPEDFLLTAMKPGGFDMAGMSQQRRAISERGITLRGFNTTGTAAPVRFDAGFGIASAARVNLMERGAQPLDCDAQGFAADVGGYSIETFALAPVLPNACLRGPLLCEAEPVQPVYVRSWEHDRGSVPMGYLAVTGVISRRVETASPTGLTLSVSMANNQPDAPARGVIRLTTEGGLTCSEAAIPYELAPHEARSWPIALSKAAPDATGVLRMEYEDDGQRFVDVLEVGRFEPGLTLEDRGDRLVATVTNPTAVRLAGELELASPIETWGAAGGAQALGALPMGQLAVELAPGESRSFTFPWSAPDDGVTRAFWAVAKLMMHGGITFAYVHRKGPRHNYWTHEFTKEIQADGGSLRRLYMRDDG